MRRLPKETVLFVFCIKQCFWYYRRESDLDMIHGRKIYGRKVYGRKRMRKDMISLVQGIFVIVKKSSNLNLFGTSVGFLFCFLFCCCCCCFCLLLGFFHKHWRFKGQHGKGKAIHRKRTDLKWAALYTH